MEIIRDNISKNIKMITIFGVDLYDKKYEDILRKILRKLTVGNEYFLNFRSEDNDFLTCEEINKYRVEIPKYLSENGNYSLNFKLDNERFEGLASLRLNDEIYKYIILLWKYYWGLSFFNPTTKVSFEKYIKLYSKIEPRTYGIGIIENNYADSIFIKGHDGDNLIFVYGSNYDESLVEEVIADIKSYYIIKR